MAIIVDENSKVIVQGITGREGSFHTKKMIEYGTNIVGGVTPGKGGSEIYGVPVFNTVADAVKETKADTTITFVPPSVGADAVLEAINAGVEKIVCITDGIPLHDELKICRASVYNNTILIGPNTPGIISPGKAVVGLMPTHIFLEGNVGILSRSGSLIYQMSNDLTKKGIGQSTVIGIGGDRVTGLSIIEVLQRFEADKQTDVIVLIGEIGGREEETAARFIKENITKPVVGYIVGLTAPPGKRMGHAGAIIEGVGGSAESKIKSLNEAGVKVGKTMAEVAEIVAKLLKR